MCYPVSIIAAQAGQFSLEITHLDYLGQLGDDRDILAAVSQIIEQSCASTGCLGVTATNFSGYE